MQEVTGSTPVSSTTHLPLVVFEDSGIRSFAPLIGLRAVFDLRCGARTLLESILASSGKVDCLALWPRAALTPLVSESHGESGRGDLPAQSKSVRFVNGRFLALGRDLERLFTSAPDHFALFSGEHLVAARADATLAAWLRGQLQARLDAPAPPETLQARLRRYQPDLTILDDRDTTAWCRHGSRLLAHVWELVEHNGAALQEQFLHAGGGGIEPDAQVDPGVHLLQPSAIRIEPGARLRPGVVLDAESGPITIAAGTDVQPLAVIRGPAWIGPGCLVKAGAKIHGNTSIGPVCKVGGEVEGSILQGYSNKQHEGYLGHAFLAEWVNLGADTNNSDLKNNYGPVRMWESGRFVDTGLLFVGLVAADHVKTAINTQLNTGSLVDVASQIAQPGFPPKYVPPFAWCTAQGIELYDWEKALRTARTVMARRQRPLTTAYEEALRKIYDVARDVHSGRSAGTTERDL